MLTSPPHSHLRGLTSDTPRPYTLAHAFSASESDETRNTDGIYPELGTRGPDRKTWADHTGPGSDHVGNTSALLVHCTVLITVLSYLLSHHLIPFFLDPDCSHRLLSLGSKYYVYCSTNYTIICK